MRIDRGSESPSGAEFSRDNRVAKGEVPGISFLEFEASSGMSSEAMFDLGFDPIGT